MAQDGTAIAATSDPAVATDIADRLNSDEPAARKTSGPPDLGGNGWHQPVVEHDIHEQYHHGCDPQDHDDQEDAVHG